MNAFNRLELQTLTQNYAPTEDALISSEVLDIVMSQRYGVEYQPIVEVQSGGVEGYQATARFWNRKRGVLIPEKVFGYLRQNPLIFFQAELELKKLQISQCPAKAGWLMLDLEIDNLIEGGETRHNPFLALFKEHIWTEREIVINLIARPDTNIDKLQLAIALLQENGIALAMKEMGVRWGTFSLSAFLDASMIKLDGASLRALTQEAVQTIAQWLIDAARRIGVQTIMTDISNCEELEWARRMGVDNVQGPLFKRQIIQANF